MEIINRCKPGPTPLSDSSGIFLTAKQWKHYITLKGLKSAIYFLTNYCTESNVKQFNFACYLLANQCID